MLNMTDEERGRRRRETTLSTSIGRILHTQQEVRSLLKNMTSAPSRHLRSAAASPPRHQAAKQDDNSPGEGLAERQSSTHKTKWAAAATPIPEHAEVLDNLNVEHCIRHPSITLGCAVCREHTQSTSCGYLYNHTLLKPWLPLCPLCYVSMREKLSH